MSNEQANKESTRSDRVDLTNQIRALVQNVDTDIMHLSQNLQEAMDNKTQTYLAVTVHDVDMEEDFIGVDIDFGKIGMVGLMLMHIMNKVALANKQLGRERYICLLVSSNWPLSTITPEQVAASMQEEPNPIKH